MRRAAVLTTALVGISVLTGCDPRPLFYFLQPFEPTIPAPGPSLKGKKVVVLTHVTSTTQAQFPGLERDIARQFTNNLKKIKKITVVVVGAAFWLMRILGGPVGPAPAGAAPAPGPVQFAPEPRKEGL
jgi:hypothetical protein